MARLMAAMEQRLTDLATALIDAGKAHRLMEPTADASGFWFGGGSCIRDPWDQDLWLSGRYRDEGDSRSGLAAGTRGRELVLLRSTDDGQRFSPVRTWQKQDLDCEGRVLSIEGSALRVRPDGVDVLVSTEKEAPYPGEVASFQKPGTGVWSIDLFAAARPEGLDPAGHIRPLLRSTAPAYLHVKDPTVSPGLGGTGSLLIYCCHPFCWSSSTSGYGELEAGEYRDGDPDFFPRGPAWDVAATRVTCRLPVPRVGALAGTEPVSLYFYDGAECLRPHESHAAAVTRPRGYSCEELGGVAYGIDSEFPGLHRISLLQPLFVSSEGTGCNRYVDVLADANGDLFATWQRSVASQAQPLFGHRLAAADVQEILK